MFRSTQNTLNNVPSITDSLTALAGGGKAGATPLTGDINRISVCATAADSALLPPALAGCNILVINDGAASAQIFGAGTDTIDAVATATGKALANGKRGIYSCYAAGKWVLTLGA